MCPVACPPPERRSARAAARRAAAVGLAAVAAAGLAGCRVDATVETRIEGRGGVVEASVELDREALSVLGGRLADGAQLSDLHQAGWTSGPEERGPDGGARMTISKRFDRPEDLAVVMEELSGRDGPLSDFRLVRRRSFASTRYRVTGAADLRSPAVVTGFGNAADLPGRLRDAGVDPGEVERLLTSRAQEGFTLTVTAEVPGGGAPVTRQVPLGERWELTATGEVSDWVRPAFLVLAGILAAAALGVARQAGVRMPFHWGKTRPRRG